MDILNFDQEGFFAPEVRMALQARPVSVRLRENLSLGVRRLFCLQGGYPVEERNQRQYRPFAEGAERLQRTCYHRKFMGHGVGTSFDPTRAILTSRQLVHRKGDVQYGNLGESDIHDSGKGLFIPKLHCSEGTLFDDLPDGSSVVPLRRIEWVVLEPNAVDEIRSETGRSILKTLGVEHTVFKKILSHNELAEMLESMPRFGR